MVSIGCSELNCDDRLRVGEGALPPPRAHTLTLAHEVGAHAMHGMSTLYAGAVRTRVHAIEWGSAVRRAQQE
jgi:hypothetical protein